MRLMLIVLALLCVACSSVSRPRVESPAPASELKFASGVVVREGSTLEDAVKELGPGIERGARVVWAFEDGTVVEAIGKEVTDVRVGAGARTPGGNYVRAESVPFGRYEPEPRPSQARQLQNARNAITYWDEALRQSNSAAAWELSRARGAWLQLLGGAEDVEPVRWCGGFKRLRGVLYASGYVDSAGNYTPGNACNSF